MFGEETDSVMAEIRRRYANRETVAEAERRIQMIALDIAQHFRDKVRPNGFKAQVVAPSRAAALRYTEQLNGFGLNAYPIITTGHNDGPEFQVAKELDQEQITNATSSTPMASRRSWSWSTCCSPASTPRWSRCYTWTARCVSMVCCRPSPASTAASPTIRTALPRKRPTASWWTTAASPTIWSRRWPASSGRMSKTPCRCWRRTQPRSSKQRPSGPSPTSEGLDLSDTWACVLLFAPDANTEGNYKADQYERFNADYRQFSRLMDRLLPDPRGLPYVDRLARLTLIRSYVRAHFLRENADVNWTDIGAKVKQLIDQRISAEVREMMQPVSILDQDFDEKIAHLPHVEARASVMEHAIRAQIHERLEQNPVFYERLSQRLARIIEQMRSQLIDAAEAYRQMAVLQKDAHGEATVAARHGLSPMSLAIYEILQEPSGDEEEERQVRQDAGSYVVDVDSGMKDVALEVERVLTAHSVIEWQTNDDVQRQMRRDVKGSLRATGRYDEDQLDELANRIVQVAKSRV